MRRLLTLLTLPTLLSACGTNLSGSVSPGGEMQEEQTVVEQVQENFAATVQIRDGGLLVLPGFSSIGKGMTRFGEVIAVFEYDSAEAAAADADKVGVDGQTTDGSPIAWEGPVHFYHHNRVLIVYVGSNEDFLAKLAADGGDQFAGN